MPRAPLDLDKRVDSARLLRRLRRLRVDCHLAADLASEGPDRASQMVRLARWLAAAEFAALVGGDAERDHLDLAARAVLPPLDGPMPPAVMEYLRQAHEATERGEAAPPRSPQVRAAFLRMRFADDTFDAHRKPRRGHRSGDVNRLAEIVRNEARAARERCLKGACGHDAGHPSQRLIRSALEIARLASGLREPEDVLAELAKLFPDVSTLDATAFARELFRRLGWTSQIFKGDDMARSRKTSRKSPPK